MLSCAAAGGATYQPCRLVQLNNVNEMGLSTGNSFEIQVLVRVNEHSTGLRAGCQLSGSTVSAVMSTARPSTVVATFDDAAVHRNRWVHLLVAHSPDHQIRLFVDGQLVSKVCECCAAQSVNSGCVCRPPWSIS